MTLSLTSLHSMTAAQRQQAQAALKKTALQHISSGNQDALRALFTSDEFAQLGISTSQFIDDYLLLHDAIKQGKADVVKLFMSYGANVNQKKNRHETGTSITTPLWTAINVQHVDNSVILETLVQQPAIDPADVVGCLAHCVDQTALSPTKILLGAFVKLIEGEFGNDDHVLRCNILLLQLYTEHLKKAETATKKKTKDRYAIIERYLIHSILYFDHKILDGKSDIKQNHINHPSFEGKTPLDTMLELGCPAATTYFEQIDTTLTHKRQHRLLAESLEASAASLSIACSAAKEELFAQSCLKTKINHNEQIQIAQKEAQARQELLAQYAYEHHMHTTHWARVNHKPTAHAKPPVGNSNHRGKLLKKGITLRQVKRRLARQKSLTAQLAKEQKALKKQSKELQRQHELDKASLQAYQQALIMHIQQCTDQAEAFLQQTLQRVDALGERITLSVEAIQAIREHMPKTPILKTNAVVLEEEPQQDDSGTLDTEDLQEDTDAQAASDQNPEEQLMDNIVVALEQASISLGLPVFYTALWYGMPDIILNHIIELFWSGQYPTFDPFIQYQGYNAFHWAVWFGRLNVLQTLLIEPATGTLRHYQNHRLGDFDFCNSSTLYGSAVRYRNQYVHTQISHDIYNFVLWYREQVLEIVSLNAL